MNDICCLLFTAKFIYQNLKIVLAIHTILFLWFPSFWSDLKWLTPFNDWKAKSEKTVCVFKSTWTQPMINFSVWLRFDQLIEYGQKMLASNPRVKQVKDRLTALKQEKAALKDTWFERNDLLNESQDLQVSVSWSFSKDAQWQDTQSCLEIDPNWKKEQRPLKNHLAENSDERGGEVGLRV